MPLSGTTFSYTNPTGATSAAAGQVVQSAVWNQIHTDLMNALNQVYPQAISMLSIRNLMAANGSFEVWQRCAGSFTAGTSTFSVNASTLQYCPDRWYIQTGANQASTVVSVAGLTNPSELGCKVVRNSAQTGVTGYVFAYPFDTPEIMRMHGKQLSFQMLAQTLANWSPTNGLFTVTLYYGTGAVGKRNATPYTNEVQGFQISTNLAAGSSVTSISGNTTVAIPNTTTQMELQIAWTPTGTAGAADAIQFDDVQLEIQNSSATWAPTTYDRIPFEIELYFCKRHYAKTFDYSVAPAQGASTLNALGAMVAAATNRVQLYWEFPVDMRSTPAITTYNPAGASANFEYYSLGVDVAVSMAVIVQSTLGGTKGISIFSSVTASSTANQIAYIQAQADAGI